MLKYATVLLIILFGINFNSNLDIDEGLPLSKLSNVENVEPEVLHMENVESNMEMTPINSCMENFGEEGDEVRQATMLDNGSYICNNDCGETPCCRIFDPEEDD